MQGSRRLAWATALVVLASLATACVTPAEHRKLQRRVHVIEKGGSAGTPHGRSRVADLGARLDALENEVARLVGRLEVAEHRAKQALDEARAARREAASDGAASVAPSQEAPAVERTEVDSAELDTYRNARAAWSEGRHDACIDQFLNFLQTYPSSSYAENASYWMADCYFKRGDFKTAVLRFDDVVARYPDGTRAPDALYRQGEALLRLGPGYGKAAGKAFERVVKEYPNSARAGEAQKQLQLLRSG